jgi:tRNA G18 (ribose-2'-O)-methylase SpoU
MGTTRIVGSRTLTTGPDAVGREGSHPWHAEKRTIAVLLDNIRSAWNVGSILRSADGFGFSHAFLCGITAAADHEAVTKTSLGAEQSVPWSYHRDAVKLVQGLKAEGWRAYALEADTRALNLRDTASITDVRSGAELKQRSDQREVLVLGNEATGVDIDLLDLCDGIFHIPMRGAKKSFNVAIAFGIAAYVLTGECSYR